MATLTVTTRGQVTFRKEVLQHLGISPGDKLELELLPGHKAAIQAPCRTGTIEDFIGCLAGKTTKVATLEEMEQAAANGWAGLID